MNRGSQMRPSVLFLAQSVDVLLSRSNPDPHDLKTYYGIVSLQWTVHSVSIDFDPGFSGRFLYWLV